jgi:L,D-transpeptidase-like protein
MRFVRVTMVLAGLALLASCATTEPAAAKKAPASAASPETSSTAPEAPRQARPMVNQANQVIVKEPPPPPAGQPCGGGVSACISLSTNQSWLIDIDTGTISYGPVPITHGRPSHPTPPGTFRVGWKDIDHLSREFDNAPMPFSVFFNGGIAFHQGSLSDPSHGCIHLSREAAETYYNALAVGDTVQVVA